MLRMQLSGLFFEWEWLRQFARAARVPLARSAKWTILGAWGAGSTRHLIGRKGMSGE